MTHCSQPAGKCNFKVEILIPKYYFLVCSNATCRQKGLSGAFVWLIQQTLHMMKAGFVLCDQMGF